MYTVGLYIDKYRYETQEQKEVPVRNTGPFRALPGGKSAAGA
jgi:hypothetical protein